MADGARVFAQALLDSEVDMNIDELGSSLFSWIFDDVAAPYRIYGVVNHIFDMLMRKYSFMNDPELGVYLLWIDDTEEYLPIAATLTSFRQSGTLETLTNRLANFHNVEMNGPLWALWDEDSHSNHNSLDDLLLDYFLQTFDKTSVAQQKLSQLYSRVPKERLEQTAKNYAGKSPRVPESIGELARMAE